MRRKGVSEGAETDYKREDQSLFINYVGAIFREGEVSIMTDEFEHECRLLYEMGLKDSTLRLEYEEKVRELSILREQMETEGKQKNRLPSQCMRDEGNWDVCIRRPLPRCSGNIFIMQLQENPGSRVEIFEGCKHWAVKEQPGKFCEIVGSVFVD